MITNQVNPFFTEKQNFFRQPGCTEPPTADNEGSRSAETAKQAELFFGTHRDTSFRFPGIRFSGDTFFQFRNVFGSFPDRNIDSQQ